MEFVAFPKKADAIFSTSIEKDKNSVVVESSGSMGLFYSGKCHQTYPNETLISDKKNEWCSNIAVSRDKMPWISYSVVNKKMKLTGYSLRNGCCWHKCCCTDDNSGNDFCCCELYSFSLQGSNDNVTWKTIHTVEKESRFLFCEFKTYEFPKTEEFRYVRLIQVEEKPNCPICMQINQLELYGDLIDSAFGGFDAEENDESVSIIGKVRSRNE